MLERKIFFHIKKSNSTKLIQNKKGLFFQRLMHSVSCTEVSILQTILFLSRVVCSLFPVYYQMVLITIFHCYLKYEDKVWNNSCYHFQKTKNFRTTRGHMPMGYMSSLSFRDYGTLFPRWYAGLCSDFANIIHQEDPSARLYWQI